MLVNPYDKDEQDYGQYDIVKLCNTKAENIVFVSSKDDDRVVDFYFFLIDDIPHKRDMDDIFSIVLDDVTLVPLDLYDRQVIFFNKKNIEKVEEFLDGI